MNKSPYDYEKPESWILLRVENSGLPGFRMYKTLNPLLGRREKNRVQGKGLRSQKAWNTGKGSLVEGLRKHRLGGSWDLVSNII